MLRGALLALFALAYCGLVLLGLALALKRVVPARRAVWLAVALSALVHGVSVFAAEPERWLPLTLFWLIPHLLWLPLLLVAAGRQRPA